MYVSLLAPTLSSGLLFIVLTATASGPAADFIRNGSAGFVVEHIEYALVTQVADGTVCPAGYTPPPRRFEKDNSSLPMSAGLPACADPQAAVPDRNFRIVSGRGAKGHGIDLDHRHSRASDIEPGICPHDDFVGMNGEQGIDNQFHRAVGCLQGYRSNALGNSFAIEMLTGSWGILILISGIDDYCDDAHVDVGFFANADQIMLSPNRQPLAYATYAAEGQPAKQRLIALSSRGRSLNLHYTCNGIYHALEKPADGHPDRETGKCASIST